MQCCRKAHFFATLAAAGRHARKWQRAAQVSSLDCRCRLWIIKCSSLRRYLQENVKARDIKLSKEELQALEEAVPASEVVGERYSEQMMKLSHNQN